MYSTKTKAVDVGLYVLVSLTVLGCVFVAAALNVPQNLFQKWSGLTGFTAVLFAQFIGNSRALWKRSTFWMFVSAVVIVHLGTLIALHGTNLKMTMFQLMLSFFAEAILLRALKNIIFRKDPSGALLTRSESSHVSRGE